MGCGRRSRSSRRVVQKAYILPGHLSGHDKATPRDFLGRSGPHHSRATTIHPQGRRSPSTNQNGDATPPTVVGSIWNLFVDGRRRPGRGPRNLPGWLAAIALTLAATAAQGDNALPTLETLAMASDVVVVGRVEAVRVHASGPGDRPGIHTETRIAIRAHVIGDTGVGLDSTLAVWTQGGELGGRRRVLVGQATFRKGETVGLFLRRTPDGALFPTALAHGRWSLAAHDATEWLIPSRATDSTGTAPMVSGGASAVTYDEFVRRVQAAPRTR